MLTIFFPKFSDTYIYCVPYDPLVEHIGSCWKFAKNEPLYAAEVFFGVINDIAKGFLEKEEDSRSYEDD